MRQVILFYTFIFSSLFTYAQFQFTGQVNQNFNNATAYLIRIDEYQKSDLLITENIIQEYKIDSLNQFHFSGDFLNSKNSLYKIYLDNCNTSITDYKHTIKHCENSNTIIFIAKNNDSIHFPLNDLSQFFCEIESSTPQNIAVLELTNLQEELLSNLHRTKSDAQRDIIFKNCFKKLQKHSKTFNDPLVELYAYYLYANKNSYSREFYLNDLKQNDYYLNLLNSLTTQYPKASYVQQYKTDLNNDGYQLLENPNSNASYITYLFAALLVISLLVNFVLLKKVKKTSNEVIDYKNVLTPQEQNVFELMHQKMSNKAIAETLFISVSTVKTHINNIYAKLNISSRKEINDFF